MKHIAEIEKRINKRPHAKTVTLPVSAVEYLLDLKNEVDRIKEEKRMLQSQLNYYKGIHPATVQEAKNLRKELNRIRKEKAHGQAKKKA